MTALEAYMLCGLLFAPFFAFLAAGRLDPAAAGTSWRFRLLLIPGAALLWPLLLGRWLRGAGTAAPTERARRVRALLPASLALVAAFLGLWGWRGRPSYPVDATIRAAMRGEADRTPTDAAWSPLFDAPRLDHWIERGADGATLHVRPRESVLVPDARLVFVTRDGEAEEVGALKGDRPRAFRWRQPRAARGELRLVRGIDGAVVARAAFGGER